MWTNTCEPWSLVEDRDWVPSGDWSGERVRADFESPKKNQERIRKLITWALSPLIKVIWWNMKIWFQRYGEPWNLNGIILCIYLWARYSQTCKKPLFASHSCWWCSTCCNVCRCRWWFFSFPKNADVLLYIWSPVFNLSKPLWLSVCCLHGRFYIRVGVYLQLRHLFTLSFTNGIIETQREIEPFRPANGMSLDSSAQIILRSRLESYIFAEYCRVCERKCMNPNPQNRRKWIKKQFVEIHITAQCILSILFCLQFQTEFS